ncbi:acyltransferase [Desulfobulbus alkaliphilus]|uniref:acyltransferase n=1 Tax=Desulfobulbus alkaliphilus TaxID=869814 RepID=UPI001F068913|nr:acyltransferase [Desulfobulbus alkaliphilus]
MKKTHAHITRGASPLRRYQEVIVGSPSFTDLLYFEWCTWLTNVPGALGIGLRKLFWPRLFAACGRGTMFGSGVILRHPGRVQLGESVVVGDGCVFDGRCDQGEDAIVLGDNVMLSNSVMLSSKNGRIRIGNDVGINAQTVIQSTSNCPVNISNDCILGQGCLVIGGGSYDLSDPDSLTRTASIINDGGVALEENVWLGARVTVLGGVTVGRGSVVAAGAVVTRSLPTFSVSMGVPAKVVRLRS